MNLILTCARRMENEAKDEIAVILAGLEDAEPKITRTGMPGILTVRTSLDPLNVVREMCRIVSEEPWRPRYCLRLIPVYDMVDTNIDDIEAGVAALSKSMPKDDTFKVSVKKRNSDISGSDIIARVAKGMPNKVSLENPDSIILVEVLGEKTGIAVIPKDGIFSAEKSRRSLTE